MSMMPPQTQTETALRREKVASLLVRGNTATEISKRLGININTTYSDIDVIQKSWKVSASGRAIMAKYIEKHLATLDEIERESWRAWERSLRPTEETTSEHSESESSGKRDRAIIRSKEQTGDPRYLKAVLDVMRQRADLLGLDAIRPSFSFDLSKLSMDQLERIAKGEDPFMVVGENGDSALMPEEVEIIAEHIG